MMTGKTVGLQSAHLRLLRVVFRLPLRRRSRNLCLFNAMMTPGL
jgi:hypothetical protein